MREAGEDCRSICFYPGGGSYISGTWHSDLPYGAVHRVASDGSTRGLTKACFDFCTKIIDYIRIDTHENNKPMQGALQKYGFRECGIIHIDDGTPRIAFDYLKN